MSSFILMATLSSCALYKLGLKYFAWITTREVTSLFDLSTEQSDQFRLLVDKETPWIRSVVAFKVAGHLDEIGNTLVLSDSDQKWSRLRKRLSLVFDDLESWRIELISRNTQPLSLLLSTLTDTQVVKLNENLKKRLKDRSKVLEEKDDEKIPKLRKEKTVANAKRWFGSLSDEQANQLCRVSDCSKQELMESVEKGQRRISRFMSTIEQHRSNPVQMSSYLRNWARDGLTNEESAVEKKTQFTERSIDVLKILNSKQLQRFQRELFDIRNDLLWFANQPVK